MDAILLITAGPLFVIFLAAHIFVRIRFRPKQNSDFDDYYHEFENQHPDFGRYAKWSRITFAGAVICALMVFIAIYI